jgi:pimeloyl-ACP methyl ester carboxylesterase
MFYALRHPERIKALISVDISPRAYHITGDNGTSFSMHKKMMEALLQLDLTTMHSRREVMKALEKDIPPERIRQFLLKNLTRDDKKRFRWKINLPVLRESLENILYGVDSDPGTGNISPASFPVLFIRGATSGYIRDEDIPLIRRLFPTAEIITIPDAGHWLHAEQPEKFLDTIRVFLQRSGIT